jgi:hypothetical protein
MSGTDDWYRELHEAKCKAKQRFHSAQQAAGAARYKETRTGYPLFYYKCPTCSKFHLTSTDPRIHDFRAFEKEIWKTHTAGLISRAEMDHALEEFKKQQNR